MKYLGLKIRILVVILAIITLFFTYNYIFSRKSETFTSSSSYKVEEIDNILTPQECDELIAYAKKKGMSDSDVLSYGSEKDTVVDSNNRKSKTAWLKDEEHPLIMKLALLSEKLTGLPRNTQEMLQVAYYEPGGKFNDHYDACNEKNKDYCDKMNRYAGQRRSTLLIYLNDSFEGGETVFPKIHVTVKPKKGKGILFWNTTPEEVIIPESMHRGNPVVGGEKWICTKWSHVKPYQ